MNLSSWSALGSYCNVFQTEVDYENLSCQSPFSFYRNFLYPV
jgi:hypothetical protein